MIDIECNSTRGQTVGDQHLLAMTQQQIQALFLKLDKMADDIHKLALDVARSSNLQARFDELEKNLDWVQKQIYLALGAGAVIGAAIAIWFKL